MSGQPMTMPELVDEVRNAARGTLDATEKMLTDASRQVKGNVEGIDEIRALAAQANVPAPTSTEVLLGWIAEAKNPAQRLLRRAIVATVTGVIPNDPA